MDSNVCVCMKHQQHGMYSYVQLHIHICNKDVSNAISSSSDFYDPLYMCPLLPCVYLSCALKTNAFAVIKVCAHKKSINCINMRTLACSVSYSSLLAMQCIFCVGSSSHLSCHALVPAYLPLCMCIHWHIEHLR